MSISFSKLLRLLLLLYRFRDNPFICVGFWLGQTKYWIPGIIYLIVALDLVAFLLIVEWVCSIWRLIGWRHLLRWGTFAQAWHVAVFADPIFVELQKVFLLLLFRRTIFIDVVQVSAFNLSVLLSVSYLIHNVVDLISL